jgi:hypothetical protein
LSTGLAATGVFSAFWWAIAGVAVLSLLVLSDHIVNVTSVVSAGFFIIGAQFVLNNFTARSFETGVRATAVGMELGIGRVGAILGPFVAGALQQFCQTPTPMLVSIGLSAIAARTIILLARRPSEAFANGFEASDNAREAPQPAAEGIVRISGTDFRTSAGNAAEVAAARSEKCKTSSIKALRCGSFSVPVRCGNCRRN